MQASSSRSPVFLATYCCSNSRSSAPPPFLGLPCRTCRAKPRGRARAGGRSRALLHFRSTAASSEACDTSLPATRVSDLCRWIRPSACRQESVRQRAKGPIECIAVPLVAGVKPDRHVGVVRGCRRRSATTARTRSRSVARSMVVYIVDQGHNNIIVDGSSLEAHGLRLRILWLALTTER